METQTRPMPKPASFIPARAKSEREGGDFVVSFRLPKSLVTAQPPDCGSVVRLDLEQVEDRPIAGG